MGGMHIYFPDFVLSVDTSIDCHLNYHPIRHSAALSELHYVQPWCVLKSLYASQAITATN